MQNPAERTLSYARRIAAMPFPEILGRGRQAASKLAERIAPQSFDADAILRDQNPAFADPGAVLRLVREKMPSRFFAGVAEPTVSGLPSAHRRDVIAAAGPLLQGRFDLLGFRGLSFGEPIDWHVDPVWERSSPNVHWSRLDPLDASEVGDSKIIWELNRHQWVAKLAQAYAVTRDERYAEAAVAAIERWMESNPPATGINWTSSLEVAYRLMSWCWTLALLRSSAALSAERASAIVAGIVLHANYVSRYLSFYFSPNTHLTGEALGLFYAGLLFPECADAARWRELGYDTLVAESAAQTCEDGVHFERSTCYHRYTVETYLQFLLLARRNGIEPPAAVVERIDRMCDFLIAIRTPDGKLPLIGDNDGGQLLPLVQRSQQDARGVLSVAGAVFGRKDCEQASEGMQPETYWLTGALDGKLGPGGICSERGGRKNDPQPQFPDAGYFVMRASADRDAHQMIVDAGPIGCRHSAGHGHADLLSLQCSIFGEPVIVDPGTYCYTPEPEWRNYFRGTLAHSTVVIDGASQAEPAGTFKWQQKPAAVLREWRSTAEVDFIDASHDAYARLGEPIVHRRRVIFVKPDYWVIVDDVTAETRQSPHAIEVAFQCAPLRAALHPGGWARAETAGGRALWMKSFMSGDELEQQITVKRGELSPARGWVSPDYGQRLPAPMVIFSMKSALPWRSLTVLIPRPDQSSSAPVVLPHRSANGFPIGVVLEDFRQSILIDDRTFLVTTI